MAKLSAFISVYVFLIGQFHVRSSPIFKSQDLKFTEETVTYLKKYGYLPPNQDKYEQKDIFEAILSLQRLTGMPTTGIITKELELIMKKPRCGELDNRDNKNHFSKSKHIQKLTYSIQAWSTKLNKTQQNSTVKKVVDDWSKRQTIPIEWKNNNSDVQIYFTTAFPTINGTHIENGKTTLKIFEHHNIFEIYLNDNQTTTVSSLEEIISHAFGHVFGLHHHDKNIKVMSPFFNHVSSCDLKLNAGFSYVKNGDTYLFKDDKYWMLTKGFVADETYPRNLSIGWPGLPNNIDEALTWGGNWNTYFFKGKYYYRFDTSINKVDSGYPRPISTGWRGVPDYIDAAFTNEKLITYFFKGSLVYQYNNILRKVASGFPKPIQNVFAGVPNNIDAAFRYYFDGEMFFFKGTYYYKWNSITNKADGPYKIKDGWKNVCLH